MADEKSLEYQRKLYEQEEACVPDDLVVDGVMMDVVTLKIPGTYKRGELMMSSGDNEFMTATAGGISGAFEVCILAENVELPEGEEAPGVRAYFEGGFSGSRLILSYETESDVHTELIEAIVPALRRSGIYVR